MAGETSIDEAGVRFVIENLESYLAGIQVANSATAGVGTKAEASAVKSGVAWGKIGKAAMRSSVIVAVAAVGIGVALLKIGGAFDEMSDTIAIKTGATGEDLAALEESAKKVFASVPADGGDVALAIGSINQKLDLTGAPLETLTTQLLELSRLTGTDLQGNIDATAQAFQRWQTPAEAMPGLLDQLFRASQESGVPVAELAASLGDNKAIIDGLGLAMPEAITLIAGLGKAGIDADTAFGGLRLALTKMAREGVEDPAAALDEYFQRIKDAPTDAAAAAIGVDIFGRQAIGLSSAIRDGTLDMDTFSAAVDANKNTIIGTGEATNDWQEKLKILSNKLMVEIAPAATALFDAVTKGVDEVGPALERFIGWFKEDVQPVIDETVRVFKEDWMPVIDRIGEQLSDFWEGLGKPIFDAIMLHIQDVARIFKEVAQTIGALIDGDWSGVLEHLKGLWDATIKYLIDTITSAGTLMFDAAKLLFGKIAEAVDAIAGDQIRAVVGMIQETIIDPIVSFATPIYEAGAELMASLVAGVAAAFDDLYGIGSGAMSALWNGLKAIWEQIQSWFDNLPSLSDLMPDIPGLGRTIAPDDPLPVLIPIKPIPFAPEGWLEEWWKSKEAEQARKDAAKRLRELWELWQQEHGGWDEFPTDRPTGPIGKQPSKINRPDLLPPERDFRQPRTVGKGGDPSEKPGLDAISDPARFLELVMQAIATIEALAGSDVPNVSRKKLLNLAHGLRSIIREFGSAMKGIKPEAAEAAAIVAGFLDPILQAVNAAVDTIKALGDVDRGIGLPRIKMVLETVANVTRVAIDQLGKLDTSKLEKTAATAELVASIIRDMAAAAAGLRDINPPGIVPGTIPGKVPPGTIPPPGGIDWSQILAGIVGSLPGRGAVLPGAPGGNSYQVNAVYTNPQSPSSIRLDLIELQMLSSA